MNGLRFSEKDIDHAVVRLGLIGEGGREEATRILLEWDQGFGDVDDIIDIWEDAPGY